MPVTLGRPAATVGATLAAAGAIVAPIVTAAAPEAAAAAPRPPAPRPAAPARRSLSLVDGGGTITLRADRVSGSLGVGPVVAAGHVVVTRGSISIRADMATYDPSAHTVSAVGNTEVDTPYGIINASSLNYDVANGGGSGAALQATIEGFSLRAERFQLVPPAAPGDAVVVIAQNGAITSCTFDHPDYLLSARWIRLQPRNSVKLQGMSASVFGARLISLPYVSFSLRPKTRTAAHSSPPGIGFGVITGPFVRWSTGTHLAPGVNSQEQVELSTKMGLTGGVTLQQVGGTPLQFSLYHRYEIPRYQYSRLTIDKTPEASSLYTGHTYAIGGIEAGYEAQISREIQAAAVLSTNTTAGHTPFAFDVLEAYRTLELRATSSNVKWGWNLDAIYDVQHRRLYDGQISIAHLLKCLRPYLGLQLRNRQVIFGVTIPAFTNLEPVRTQPVYSPGAGLPSFTWNEGESLPTVLP
ncbi:MAG: hypothetical protein LC772_13250 [Chloroflexi bacterium]|nr:hypothetical protein [Chloroflexota bacterium]